MKIIKKLVGLLGFLLLLFCLLVVCWQFNEGTKKYLATPVANKIYSDEAELPVITICHRKKSLRMGTTHGLDYEDFKAGKLLPDDSGNMSAIAVFKEAIEANYYLLDITGLINFIIIKIIWINLDTIN